MKKLVAYVVFLIALSWLAPFTQAETPPLETVDNEGLFGTGRSAFVKMTINDAASAKALEGLVAPNIQQQDFNIIGQVIPLVQSVEDEHNFTNLMPFHTWFGNTSTINLMPGYFTLIKPYVPFTTEQTGTAHYCAILTIPGSEYVGFAQIGPVTTNANPPEESKNIPWTQPLYTDAQFLGSVLSTARLPADSNGKIVFDKPKSIVARIDPSSECPKQDNYVEQGPKISDVVTKARFLGDALVQSSIIQTLLICIGDPVRCIIGTVSVPAEVLITKKSKISGNTLLDNIGYGFKARELSKWVVDHSRTPSDGAFASLVAYTQRRDPIGFAGTENQIKVEGNINKTKNYINREAVINRFYETTRQGTCSLTPSHFIPSYKIGGEIPIASACAPPSPTPSAGGWNCNTNVGEQSVSGLNKSYGQSFANGYCSENAWAKCNNDVIARAKKACVDPIFALAIWLHESAASSYKCGEAANNGAKVEDFGIHTATNVKAEDFSAQLDRFLKLNYSCPHTIHDWVGQFYKGKCYAQLSGNDLDDVNAYVKDLQDNYYSPLGGGTLPDWPPGSGC